MMQVIEMSLEFLESHPNFTYAQRNNFTQPLLRAANIIEPVYMNIIVKII